MAAHGGGMVERIVLKMQAHGGRLPPSARSVARGLVSRFRLVSESDPELESWDQPLVAGRPVSPLPEPTASEGSYSETSRLEPDGRQGLSAVSGRRCLVLTDVLDVGGLDEFAAFLARWLPALGWSVSVVKTGAPGGYLADVLRREGMPVLEAASPEDLRHVLDGERPDVISAHAPTDWTLQVAGDLGIPVVETLHGAPTPLTTDWAAEPERSARVTAFIAVSDLVRRHYLRGNPRYPSAAVVVVPNGYDASKRPAVDRDAARAWLGLTEEFLFVSMGRLSAEKNTYGLVAAFAELAADHPGCQLLAAGRVDDPVYARQVLRLTSGLPKSVHDRIHVRGNTPQVGAVLAAADCLVMNSFYEGWGLASMEALAVGLPVIRSDTGGAIEQVGEGGRRGYLVPNPLHNPESVTWSTISPARYVDQANRRELVAAMAAVVADRHRWAAQRGRIAAEATAMFSLAECARNHSAVLLHAAQRRTPDGFNDFVLTGSGPDGKDAPL